MNNKERLVSALKAALHNSEVFWNEAVSDEEWVEFFEFAAKQNVLSIIWQAVYNCNSIKTLSKDIYNKYKKAALKLVAFQSIQTDRFLELYKCFADNNIFPVVVKGIVCRNTYPFPDNRASTDEDLFVTESDIIRLDVLMKNNGMLRKSDVLEDNPEVIYESTNGTLKIELHSDLLPAADGSLDRFKGVFDNSIDNAISQNICGVDILTMNHTDHILYLICHLFQHFISRGTGIRQACDIIMYANKFGCEIEWKLLLEKCRALRLDVFTAAIFEIGIKHLGFDLRNSGYPDEWESLSVECEPLLDEMLSSGVFGDFGATGWGTASYTSNAVAVDNSKGGAVLRSVFPSYEFMKERNPYLKKHPYLLPFAWTQRAVKYAKEIKNSSSDVQLSVEGGKHRVDLLKKYKVI